jgi:hypothetical protein
MYRECPMLTAGYRPSAAPGRGRTVYGRDQGPLRGDDGLTPSRCMEDSGKLGGIAIICEI